MSSKLSKVLSVAKLIVYAIIIVGAVLYLYGLYESRGEWRVELAAPPKVRFVSPTVVTIEVPLHIYNPSGGEVSAKLVYYQVYLNNVNVGDGLIPYLKIPPGWSNRTLRVTVDLLDLGCGGVDAIMKGEARISVSGYAMVDIKTVGGLTWKTVTVPFNTTAKKVRIPEVPDEAKAGLAAVEAMCKASHSGLPGVSLPFQGGGSQGSSGTGSQYQGGGGGSQGNVAVEIRFERVGVGRYEVQVLVENHMSVAVHVSRIVVSTPLRDYQEDVSITLAPGESRLYSTGVIVVSGTPVEVKVYTSAGVYKARGSA